MNLVKAFPLILKQEGIATTCVPGDKGKLTKFGIDEVSHPGVDIANLTLETAQVIYNDEYWTPCKCDSLIPELQYAHFSCAVNDGPGSANKILQRACGVLDDGIIGPMTLAASTKIHLADYAKQWALHYQAIVTNEKNKIIEEKGEDVYNQMLAAGETQEKFLQGWLNRINTVQLWWAQGTTA